MELFTIEPVIEAVKAGGKIVRAYFGEVLELTHKSSAADFRTKADLESEAVILEVLEKAFPSYNIFSEERGSIEKNSEYTFLIDPLDGTNNFMLGIPLFNVSIGLIKGGELQAGVIYNPILDQVYRAEKGKGAYCDDKKITVNNATAFERLSVCYTCSYSTKMEHVFEVKKALYDKDVMRVMNNWCPTLDYCLLASGKIEAIISDGNELHDFAAGKLIVQEAGAQITDFNGLPESDQRNPFFLMSNATDIHKQLLTIIPRS